MSEITPNQIIKLPVTDGHVLHIEEFGNPNGFPMLYLHGGPGAGCSFQEYKLFDVNKVRVILFDQRGAGKSTLYASLNGQHSDNLVEDINAIRDHLSLDKIGLVGGSWGSALAMLYAQKYPHHVTYMQLRGLFFADKEGAENIAEFGKVAMMRTRYWDQYAQWDKATHYMATHDVGLIESYDYLLNCDDEAITLEAAARFMVWDTSIAYASYPETHILDAIHRNPKEELAISRIFMHFSKNEFLKRSADAMLRSQEAFKNISIDVVHGAQDYICLPKNADAFKRAYPHSNVEIIANNGHSITEPEIYSTTQRQLKAFIAKM